MISRPGGEGADLPTDMAAVIDGSFNNGSSSYNSSFTNNSTAYHEFEKGQHYLELSKSERDMLSLVCSNFDKVAVVYNGANAMELSFVEDYPQIKSVLWCPGTGQGGFNALGSILNGETNPSGKTADTFVYDLTATPTWNKDLAKEFGRSIGKMADQMGVSGWYAPAMNTHRSAFAGRNFEYYSEDGLLSGKIAANAVQGAEEYGVYAYIKHYALNDQEAYRNEMLCTWVNEQSIREIYLKPFEIAVKEGGADAVMSSFNYIGTQWAGGTNALCNIVLRDEWGFRGMVLTDYFGVYGYMNSDQAIRNGTDICLVNYDTETNHVKDTASATSVRAMRQASKNILYTVVNSRAYAPENLNTGMDGWQIAAIVIDVIIAAALILIEVKVMKSYRQKKAVR